MKQSIKLLSNYTFSSVRPPASDKLILLKDAIFDMIKNINSNCKIYQKYKKPKPTHVVSFSLAKSLSETIDLYLEE